MARYSRAVFDYPHPGQNTVLATVAQVPMTWVGLLLEASLSSLNGMNGRIESLSDLFAGSDSIYWFYVAKMGTKRGKIRKVVLSFIQTQKITPWRDLINSEWTQFLSWRGWYPKTAQFIFRHSSFVQPVYKEYISIWVDVDASNEINSLLFSCIFRTHVWKDLNFACRFIHIQHSPSKTEIK